MTDVTYAICSFNLNTANNIDTSGLTWHRGKEKAALDKVHRSKGAVCALFYPGDVPDKGIPVNKSIDRKSFEAAPALYGVCYYKSWNGSYIYE